MPAPISYVGRKFGRLKVIANAPYKIYPNGRKRARSWCLCKCGSKIIVSNEQLRDGTRSCGCLIKDILRQIRTTHGHTINCSETKTYNAWCSMIQRCTNPKKWAYKFYGARGIMVCKRWMNFSNFLKDMGEAPIGYSLGRKNNDGNYHKRNCRWETRSQQMRNRRDTRFYTVNGITGGVTELSEHFGILMGTAWSRLKLGWSAHKAFTKPVRTCRASRC